MHAEAARTWRRAKQSAVRRYGAGPIADHAAAAAVKRLVKWLARHRPHAARPWRASEDEVVHTQG